MTERKKERGKEKGQREKRRKNNDFCFLQGKPVMTGGKKETN